MSVSYKAHAVLGVELTHHELFKPKKVKAYEHNHPEDWQVDPKTGRKLWATYPVCILNNNEELYGKVTDELQVVNDGNYERPADHYYYLGKVVSSGDYEKDSNFLSNWNTDEIKKNLQELLEPHNLWFPERFGIYAVRYVC